MTATLLDLYCGAGGATAGYQRAGFKVVGVDKNLQPRYVGDDFVQADAFEYLSKNWWKFDAIHASPPCQRYSMMTRASGTMNEHPDDIAKMRAWLQFYNKPYVIENVPRSPLVKPTELCGLMFGKLLYRHRLFETNFKVKTPMHPWHRYKAQEPSKWEPGMVMSVVGNCSPVAHAREIMDINWMVAEELSQAIPPYYTEYIGDALRRYLNRLSRIAS